LLSIADRYQPAVTTPISVHMFRETDGIAVPHPLESSYTDYLPDKGWSHWSGTPVTLHRCPANHNSIILDSAAVNSLAAELRGVLDDYRTANHYQ
jgi:hypothetical protein